MELTPELLLEAKFGPARRGYDMAEVDDFLERCAEGLDVLLARLRSEFERAENAEARLATSGSGGVAPVDSTVIEPSPEDPASDARTFDVAAPEVETHDVPAPPIDHVVPSAPAVEEPMRILVAAERTAEAAVADARAEAERIRSEAESVASQQRSEAESMLATAKATAEDEARRAGEESKRIVQAEVLALRRDRDGLSDDVRSLRRWLDEQRTRMRTTARELQRMVEDPSALQDLAVPDLSDPVDSGLDPIAGAASATGDVAPPAAFESDVDDAGEATQAVPAVDVDDPWSDSPD